MKLSQLKGQYTVESEAPMKLSQLPQGSYEVVKEEPPLMSGRGLLKAGVESLPILGAVGGGLLGSVGGPLGAVGGAGLGAGAGKGLQNIAETYLYDKAPESTGQMYQDIGKEMVMGGAGEGAGQALAKGASGLLDKAGRSIYRSAFKKIDERTAEKGAKKLADVLLEHGAPVGTTKKIAGDIRKLSDELLTKRTGLYKEGTDLGALVDVEKASAPALSEANRLKGVRGAEDLGKELSGKVSSLFKRSGDQINPLTLTPEEIKLPKLSLEEASELKTRLNDILPDKAFDKFGRVKKDAQVITKKQAQGLRMEIIKEANKVRPGLGDEIDAINEDLASILSSQQPMKIQIRRGETPNAVTSVDAMLGALTSPQALATKKAADLSKLTSVRTGIGKGLLSTKAATKNVLPLGSKEASQVLLRKKLENE